MNYYFHSDYFSMRVRDTWWTGKTADHSVAAGGSVLIFFARQVLCFYTTNLMHVFALI